MNIVGQKRFLTRADNIKVFILIFLLLISAFFISSYATFASQPDDIESDSLTKYEAIIDRFNLEINDRSTTATVTRAEVLVLLLLSK